MMTGIMTSKKLLVSLLLLSCFQFYCQTSGNGVGIGTLSPRALLDIHSTNVTDGGILIPRYSVAEVSSLNLNAEHDSMLFFVKESSNNTIIQGTGIAVNVTSAGYYYYSSKDNLLIKLSTGSDTLNAWGMSGSNANASHFIGTTNNMPIKLKIDNTLSGIVSKQNIGLGYNALNTITTNSLSGYNNIAFGVNSMQDLTTGTDNIGIGFSALKNSTTAQDNVAIGNESLSRLIDGTDNIAIGKSVLANLPSGRYNIGIGGRIMQDASSATRQNIGIGYRVLNKVNVTDAFNIGIGYGVLEKGETVKDNVAIGRSTFAALVTGDANVTLGREALENMVAGNNNVALGFRAGESIVNGNSNVIIGSQALQFVTTATDNIVIGNRSAPNLLTGTNNIVIGNLNQTSSATISNEVTLGNQNITSYRMWTNGWTTISDGTVKNNVQALTLGLDFVNDLKPSEFVFNNESTNVKSYGFIAQDIQRSLQKYRISNAGLLKGFGNGLLGLRMNDFIPILAKAIQEQNVIIQNQKSEIDLLKAEIQAIKTALNIN